MSYSPVLKDLASFVKDAYLPLEKRPDIKTLLGKELKYKKKLSTKLFSHYENEEIILVSVHGADSFESILLGVKTFLRSSQERKLVGQFCNKYAQLLGVKNKKVFLTAHSLGTFMIANCSLISGKSFPSVFFAPYVPSPRTPVSIHLGTNNAFKKIFYQQDQFPGNLINMGKKVKNTLMFSNANPIFTIRNKNNHSINLFTTDISKDFKRKLG